LDGTEIAAGSSNDGVGRCHVRIGAYAGVAAAAAAAAAMTT
jgi:hypothetical protein